MIRSGSSALLALFFCTLCGVAQELPRFRYQEGQILTYKGEQNTKIEETILDDKTKKPVDSTLSMKLRVVRQFKVRSVEASGTAILEMSILGLRTERQIGTEEAEIFDSDKPDPSNPSHKESLQHLGKVIAVLKLDGRGQVVEVIEPKGAGAARFQSELPFKIVLPETAVPEGQVWDRTWAIAPQGGSDGCEAVQKFALKPPITGFTVIGVTTSLKKPPEIPAEQIPLFSQLPEGDVYLHAKSGIYTGARLKIQKSLVNHEGEGSKYSFSSTYTEDFVQPK